MEPADPPAILALGAAEIDLINLRARTPGGEVPLSAQEGSLLALLASNRGATVSRERLLQDVWGYSARSATRAVDNAVSRLRRKIEPEPSAPRWLVSTRGGGYRLEAEPAVAAPRLPAERDSFLGREAELSELDRLLGAGAMLVSIVGAGGIGKTRLALRRAGAWGERYPGGALFCDLSDAVDPGGIEIAVARALDLPLGPDGATQIGHALAARGRCLVLLDNFERVVGCAEATVGRWLDQAREARFLITSRERLGVVGEVVFDVPPLAPDFAVELFVARASAVSRSFAPTSSDRTVIRELVRLLDHIPLAIELCASRMNLLTPEMALERMADRFRLLASAGRPARQATLKATLDWSWALLGPAERSALAELTVFEGGFTLEAAEGVLTTDSPLDTVQRLVDKSLVRRVASDRLDLLASVREYARAHLPDPRSAEERHGAYLARAWDPDEGDGRLVPWPLARWRKLAAEIDNLTAACRRAIARGDAPIAARTARAAWRVLEWTGPYAPATALLEAALALPGCDPAMTGELHLLAGVAHRLQGRAADAERHDTAAAELARAHRLPLLEARAFNERGLVRFDQMRLDEARHELEAALAMFRSSGYRLGEVLALGNLGSVEAMAGWTEARAHLEEALAGHREAGAYRSEGTVLTNLGILHMNEGRSEDARRCLEEALEARTEFGDRRAIGVVLANLSTLASQLGREDEADALLERALACAVEVGDRRAEAIRRINLASARTIRGVRLGEAQSHLVRSMAISHELGHRHLEAIAQSVLGDLCRRTGDPSTARAHLDAAEASLRAIGDRVELVRVLCFRVELERGLGEERAAQEIFDEVERLADQLGATPGCPIGQRLSALRR